MTAIETKDHPAVQQARTHGDVLLDITAKRDQIYLASIKLREARETVMRAEAHVALLEAQMTALATEDAEWERRSRAANVGAIPFDYKPPVFDPKREIESGVCGPARPLVTAV